MLHHGSGGVNPARAPAISPARMSAARSVFGQRWRWGATRRRYEASRGRMIEDAIPTLVLIGVAAVLAPIIAEGTRRFLPVPEVVIQILLGILIGPYVLALAHPNTIVTALSDFGLTYLMFLAGTELDLEIMRRGHLGLAAGSWGVSVILALARRGRAARDRSRHRLGRGRALPDDDGAHDAAPHPARRRRAPDRDSGRRCCRWVPSGSSAPSWRSPSCSRTATSG